VRKSVLEDPSLSVWAFRLLLYMITKPEDFVFIPGVLMRDGNLPRGPRGGRTWIVEEALPELRKAGFVEPVQARRPDGTLGRGGTWRLVRDMAIVPEQEGAGSRQAVKGGHREAGRFRRSQPLVRQPHFAS